MERKKLQINEFYQKQNKDMFRIAVLFLVTVILFLTSLFIGQYGIKVVDAIKAIFFIDNSTQSESFRNIIFNIRLPRTISSAVIGGILAISGLTYQCVFRNNLVSQDILGVSTSACVGAAIGIVLGMSAVSIQFLAFAFGIVNILLVFLLSSRIKLDKTLSLVLSGILIGGAMSSVLGLIKYMANPETHLQAIVFWTMGDVSSVTYEQLLYIAFPVVVCTVIIFLKRWELNYFCYSDTEAKSLGINITMNRIIFIICSTVLVASAVSVSGSIGWVGLVIPQLVRIIVGTNNKYTVPLTFLMGSSFLLVVDIINRLISSAELPVSIISGIIGLPLFVACWFVNTKEKQVRF